MQVLSSSSKNSILPPLYNQSNEICCRDDTSCGKERSHTSFSKGRRYSQPVKEMLLVPEPPKLPAPTSSKQQQLSRVNARRKQRLPNQSDISEMCRHNPHRPILEETITTLGGANRPHAELNGVANVASTMTSHRKVPFPQRERCCYHTEHTKSGIHFQLENKCETIGRRKQGKEYFQDVKGEETRIAFQQKSTQLQHMQTRSREVHRFIFTVGDDQVTEVVPYFANMEVDCTFTETRARRSGSTTRFQELPKNDDSLEFFQSSSQEAEHSTQPSTIFEGESSPTVNPDEIQTMSLLQVPRRRRVAVSGPCSASGNEPFSDRSRRIRCRRDTVCSSTDEFDKDRRFLCVLSKKF